jgi:imidazolonepropionase-like amidohydrolase
VGVLAALKSITINAAMQLAVDDVTGMLEKGKSADFVVLNGDPTVVEKGELNSLQTWFKGVKVFNRDELKVEAWEE